MKSMDIPVLPAKDEATHAQKVRLRAPKYLKSVIEDDRALPGVRTLAELRDEQITALGGGVDAATYLITADSGQWIVKLGLSGLEAEVEALKRWKRTDARVPAVVSSGIVPSTRRVTPHIKYIVEEAVTDKFGRIAETAEAYLEHAPGDARKIGRLMGAELAKLHTAVTTKSFGDFGDRDANTAPYKSWNNYLIAALEVQKKHLRSIGISDEQIRGIKKFIEQCAFVKRGSYLHGDFSIRNTTVRPYKTEVILFDPNPLIGDPSWDAAVLYNNYEFRKRLMKHDSKDATLTNRDKQLLTGFRQSCPTLDEDNLLTARLLQALFQAEHYESKLKRGNASKYEVQVRHDFIHETVQKIVRRVEHD